MTSHPRQITTLQSRTTKTLPGGTTQIITSETRKLSYVSYLLLITLNESPQTILVGPKSHQPPAI